MPARGFRPTPMSAAQSKNPVFVALDTPDLEKALTIAEAVGPYVGGLKIGLEFVTAQGPRGIEAIVALGRPVFADVKFHDIPNTVAGASRALARSGVALFNIHVSGGETMIRWALDAARNANPSIRVLGVTVLTSLDDAELDKVGQRGPSASQVERLSRFARSCGLDGVVCSPQEIALVRNACGKEFLIATPGIRPTGADPADQRRVTTPEDALSAGADILVVGRPITDAPDPAAAARNIARSLRLIGAE